MLLWPKKDPDDTVDYSIDWYGEDKAGKRGQLLIDNDTIALSTWTVPAGLTQPQAATTDTKVTTIWLAGGSHGVTYTLINHITTAGGRQYDQSVKLPVRTR